ncbi:MAG: cytochrome c oxidase subunit II [Thermoleophilia bacterium]
MIGVVDTAGQYEDIFAVYWPIAAAVTVIIWLGLLVLAIRFRRRAGDDAWPEQTHAHPRLEVSYVALLAVIAAVLVYLTFSTMDSLRADLPAESTAADRSDADPSQAPPAAVTIEVVGARWNWRFAYAGLGIEQVGDGRTIPTLVVPRGDVRFRATSVDVIHSFFIPYLRFKRDAFPERWTNFTLGFDEVGFHEAEGRCAEFCGLRHAYMQFNVRVLEPSAFRRWAQARRSGAPQELSPALNRDGRRR